MSANYRFGQFTLSSDERVLRSHGELVPAAPKSLSLLLVLLEAAGRIVPKDEILRAVWSNSFVEEGNLSQHISVLRKILAAGFPGASPIETIPRVGYCFREAVERVEDTLATPFLPAQVSREETVAANEDTPAFELRPASAEHRSKWIFAAALVLLLAAVGAWVALHMQLPHKLSGKTLTLTRLTSNAGEDRVIAAAISPDGKQMALMAGHGLMLENLGERSTRTLNGPQLRLVNQLAWFPEGLHLLVSGVDRDGLSGIWLVSLLGEEPRLLRADARLGIPSPDGRTIACISASLNEVWLIGPHGEEPRRLYEDSPTTSFIVLLWTRDGKHLLLSRQAQLSKTEHFPAGSIDALNGNHPAYVALDAATGKMTALQDGVRFNNAIALSDGGVFFSRPEGSDFGSSSSFWEVRLDPATGAFATAPVEMQPASRLLVLGLSISPQTGEIVTVMKTGLPSVYVGDLKRAASGVPSLANVRRLSLDGSAAYPHSWSPDSKAVLYEALNSGYAQVYVHTLDHRDPTKLSESIQREVLPRVTPDGHWVLFRLDHGDEPEKIARVPLTGGTPTVIPGLDANGEYRCPLHRGQCVFESNAPDHTYSFFTLDPLSGRGKLLFHSPVSWKQIVDWDVSPDGQELAIVLQWPTEPSIVVVGLATSRMTTIPVRTEADLKAVNWTADGRGWLVATRNPAGSDLSYVDPRGHVSLLRQTMGSTWAVASPDGQMLAFVDQQVDSNAWHLQPGITR
jgi:DNA-binding winged helix-turn-helix (wHTH) protein/Tol biopolymer transport system component